MKSCAGPSRSVVQQERLRALGQMASGVAHDVNNALSPVMAYSELLLSTLPDLPGFRGITCKPSTRRAGTSLKSLPACGNSTVADPTSEQLTEVNVNQTIEEVIELTRPRWRDLPQREGISIQIQHELEPELPLLLSDPAELREALTNLVFNAVDALPQGGVITLVTRSVPRPVSEGEWRLGAQTSG